MWRRAYDFALVCCILFGLISTALWLASFWKYEFVSRERSYRKIPPTVVRQEVYAAACTDGVIHLRRAWSDWNLESETEADRACREKPHAAWWFAGHFQFEIDSAKLLGSRYILTRLGFATEKWDATSAGSVDHYRGVYFPAWLPALVLLPSPVI